MRYRALGNAIGSPSDNSTRASGFIFIYQHKSIYHHQDWTGTWLACVSKTYSVTQQQERLNKFLDKIEQSVGWLSRDHNHREYKSRSI